MGGIDAFGLADDWGGSTGLLMSPAHLRRFFIKPFAEIVHGMKKLGLPVMMHNDGNLWEVMDDLVASGINGFHPVERAATMDLGKDQEPLRHEALSHRQHQQQDHHGLRERRKT